MFGLQSVWICGLKVVGFGLHGFRVFEEPLRDCMQARFMCSKAQMAFAVVVVLG